MKSALKNKNLQLYFGGQFISMIGTWMQQMALSWMVYRLTNSPFALGLIGFTSQIPSLLLTPFAGLVVDRSNRHKLILITQTFALLQASLLALLVWTGQAQLWQLILLSAFLGLITAFDLPARQSFLVDMLDDNEQMASAIGINSSINTLTRLIGPFIAGIFVAWAGEAVCFLTNALSYVAVIIALMFVKTNQRKAQSTKTGAMAQLKEGFNYTVGFAPIRDLILLLALFGLVAMPFAVLMPAFARDVFHGNAMTLGILTGASAAGSVAGAVLLTKWRGTQALSGLILVGCILCGLGLVIFGCSTYLPVSLLAVMVVGYGSMNVLAGSNTIIQTIVEEDKRGRVMSFVVMAFLGLSPFGGIAAGALANYIGTGNTVIASGIFTLILACFFGTRILQIHSKVTAAQTKVGVDEAETEMVLAELKL